MRGCNMESKEPQCGTSGVKSKAVKVWNKEKSKGKVITCYGFRDLTTKVKEKFSIPSEEEIRIVCGDGCEIDDTDGLDGVTVNENSLYFLRGNENLNLPESIGIPERESFTRMVESLKRKRGLPCENNQKKERLSVRVNMGLMQYNASQKRYVTVRSQKGGGIRVEEILKTISYDDLLTKLTGIFFPNGKCALGKTTKFKFTIGDKRGMAIDRANFSIDQGDKIYLLSKEKTFLLDSSDSDSDFSLPEISFRNPKTPTVHHLSQTLEPLSTTSPMITVYQSHENTGTPTVSFNPDTFKCSVCYERPRTNFIIPCGHQYCLVCVTQLEGNSGVCAFCRGPIQAVGKLQEI